MPPAKMSEVELEMKSAILSTGMVQPVDSFSKGGYAEVLGRQVPGQEKTWLSTVKALLIEAEKSAIDLHICRRYLVKDGELVYGWFIAIDTKSQKKLEEVVAKLKAEVLDGARPSLAGPQPVQQHLPVPAPQRAPQAPPRPRTDEQAVQRMSQNPHGRMNGMQPRPPNPAGPDPQPPPGFQLGIVTVQEGRDSNGVPITVQEMPLPHMYGDTNRPTQPVFDESLGRLRGGGRGAKGVG